MRALRILLPAAFLLTACADGPLDPAPAQPQALVVAAAADTDVGGDWIWDRVERLSFPAWVAAMFGVQPEGPYTIATCVTAGTLYLDQTGGALQGFSTATEHECTTRGGQVFQAAAGNAPVPVTGEVRGRAVFLTLDAFAVDCLIHAVANTDAAGAATTLQGAGRCIVPGHPQSDVPGLAPPPAGTDLISSFTAVRPG